ncbi:MAG: hypothetical protein M3N46_00885 [Actinomycetota bacterium]|nr:hypothetical protein [Actinomycetota bacterium]
MNPDLDDTVARPPRHAIVERATDHLDVEDTITWTRPATAPIELPQAAESNSVPEATTVQTPPALVEPPASSTWSGSASRLPQPPVPGTAIPDVSDNVWSEPIPDKPLPFRILLDDGTLVPLDQPVYLGRKPSVPRIHPGGVPLLVTFDSPQREVSSTHLELTTVGGAIVATDLKSTNGSIVRVPGAAPHTLLGGESAVLTPGTVIELGDGNSIELLAPETEGAA